MVAQDNSTLDKMVYIFGGGSAEGSAEDKNLLGGKGANLAEMASIGLPVPPGFTITTAVCTAYNDGHQTLPDGLHAELQSGLKHIENLTGTKFGDVNNPLLISVRSGSRASMPGMMDTILNLGLNDETVHGLVKNAGDARFVFDSYRRFIQMYANVVLGIDHGVFEDLLEDHKNLNAMMLDTELSAEDWQILIKRYKDAVYAELNEPFPQDVEQQLWGAIAAVFGSWQNPRAKTYRRLNNIPDSWGTAVNVQAMVFGNMGDTSATGVSFTRNPATGEKEIYGEYLINAQGEDVVSGIRTPQPVTEAAAKNASGDAISLEKAMPDAFRELAVLMEKLENHYRDMQDIEFTIENGKLWMLQTRSGKRTVDAAVRVAVEMAQEGIIGRDEALIRLEPSALDQLLHPTLDESVTADIVTQGLPASPGAASGEIVLNADVAEAAKAKGRDVILVRTETSPEDIHGMHAAVGILTARGGMTSHAAVVARGMGRACVSGAGALQINEASGTVQIGTETFKAGDMITIDGSSGRVMRGRAKMRQPKMSSAFNTLMSWADERRRLKVRTNADTPHDAKQARDFGAEGIGLCRTEHMFFDGDRLIAMRKMICADDEAGRRAALAEILPMQRDDFAELFEIMSGLPVTIRLLDPPLHEFLPKEEKDLAAVADGLGVAPSRLTSKVRELAEFNPMLGFRGCRLAVRYPEITEMQARAVFEGASIAAKKTGALVRPEIMIPLVAYRQEFDILADVIREVADQVVQQTGEEIPYDIGTMVELPRACLIADKIAAGDRGAAFFSFGTNDLTQTTLGLSRDDSAPILQSYNDRGVIQNDPFAAIDRDGVGALIELGTQKGRQQKPSLKVGICGEHGGDPQSIGFCEETGLDYVSCSPFRVPVARLAAAQAVVTAQQKEKSNLG
ncbi:MAG: pyruvate, phosphate dikinase [Hyphomicrobiaceae bacterium]